MTGIRPRILAAALLALAACGREAPPAPGALGDAVLVLASFDSALVDLTGGVGEARNPDGVVIARAALAEWEVVDDLDGDGRPEALVVVVVSGGGSGTFVELAHFAMVSDDGAAPAWTWRGSIPLGDRVGVRGLERTAEGVELYLTVHGPDDPLCCPTVEVVRAFAIVGGRLARS